MNRLNQILSNWNNRLSQSDRDAVKVRAFAVFALFVMVFFLLVGCSPPTKRLDPQLANEYKQMVEQERKAYDKIATQFQHYVQVDDSLDVVAQADYFLSITVWDSHILKHEGILKKLFQAGLVR